MARLAAPLTFGVRIIPHLPLALLALVVLHHGYQVRVHGLTRWKGGGFGMFATIDSQDTRFVRLYVVTGQGESVLARADQYVTQLERARYLPHEPQTEALASTLARRAWTAGGPTPGSGGLRLATERDVATVRPVSVRAVRIEIFTLEYDQSSHRLAARALRVVEAQAPR